MVKKTKVVTKRSKSEPSVGASAIAGLRAAIAHAKGETVPGLIVREPVDVKAIRERTGLSQGLFAAKFGLPAPTLRAWEQGVRVPERAAELYLRVIDAEPEAVERALHGLQELATAASGKKRAGAAAARHA